MSNILFTSLVELVVLSKYAGNNDITFKSSIRSKYNEIMKLYISNKGFIITVSIFRNILNE